MIHQEIRNTDLFGDIAYIDKFLDIFCYGCFLKKDLSYLQNARFKKWSSSFKKYVVFGTGGSALGGEAIQAFLARYSNVIFIDNLDYENYKKTLDGIEFKSTGFLVISKSGETIETIAQMLTVFNFFQKCEIKDHFFCITENKDSTIKRICNVYDISTIDHPRDIGGRFSVFSPVGMTVAYLLGADCNKIFAGADAAITDIKNNSENLSFLVSLNNRGISDIVFMSYSEKFNGLCMWVRQLIAESSGKDGIGFTPIIAKGPVDQHSQLQLYLGGEQNKGFTFFLDHHQINEIDEKLKICALDSSIDFIHKKTIKDLIDAEASATIEALCEANLPVRIFKVDEINEYSLGYLFIYFMVEIIHTCRFIGVNPFDQPHVERIKILTKEYLK